jgi:hypothetical protein
MALFFHHYRLPEDIVGEVEEDDALLRIEEALRVHEEGDEGEGGGEVAEHRPYSQPDLGKVLVLLKVA